MEYEPKYSWSFGASRVVFLACLSLLAFASCDSSKDSSSAVAGAGLDVLPGITATVSTTKLFNDGEDCYHPSIDF